MPWQTGTQTLGTVDGLTADSAGPPNYLTNAHCFGAWSYEDDANDQTTTGSGSNGGNDLTKAAGTYSATNAKWGSKSIYGAANGNIGLSIADSSLASGTPSKYGTTTTAFTIGGWASLIDTDGSVVMWMGQSYMTPYSYEVFNNRVSGANHLKFAIGLSSGNKSIVSASTFTAGTMICWAAVWDGSYIHLYYGTSYSNMAEDSGGAVAASGTLNTSSSALFGICILADGGSPISWGGGYHDMNFVFDTALTLTEIKGIFQHNIDGSQ